MRHRELYPPTCPGACELGNFWYGPRWLGHRPALASARTSVGKFRVPESGAFGRRFFGFEANERRCFSSAADRAPVMCANAEPHAQQHACSRSKIKKRRSKGAPQIHCVGISILYTRRFRRRRRPSPARAVPKIASEAGSGTVVEPPFAANPVAAAPSAVLHGFRHAKAWIAAIDP